MASLRCNLRLSDVHSAADRVGRGFKKLSDRFGMECVLNLLPTVVWGLECLEAYVERYQSLQTRLSELQMENEALNHEKEQISTLTKENKVYTPRLISELVPRGTWVATPQQYTLFRVNKSPSAFYFSLP